MTSVLLSIKTDPQTKQELKEFASDMGLTTTALVNMVIKKTLREKRIVLEPTPYLEKIMRQADKDLKAGKTSGPFHTADEAIAHLKSLM